MMAKEAKRRKSETKQMVFDSHLLEKDWLQEN